jgi:hypothetical protein
MGKAKRRDEPRLTAVDFIKGSKATAKPPMTKATLYIPEQIHDDAKVWAVRNKSSLSAMTAQGLLLVMASKK